MDRFLALPRYTFLPASIRSAPQWEGVYGLFERDELIFIGATGSLRRTLRECLASHSEGEHSECTRKATRYTWEIAALPETRESDLLAQFGERHRRKPRCQS